MKKFVLMIMALALVCFLFAGCATITAPVAATSNPVGSKVGQASGTIWLHVFGTADAGIRAAARRADIRTISTVDYTTQLGIFGLYTKYTVTITGE